MDRPIVLLQFPDEVNARLHRYGFNYIEDIQKCLKDFGEVPENLRGLFEEYKILDRIETLSHMSTLESASEKLLKLSKPIPIFHEGLSKLLNGGLLPGQIIELCGPSGSGKTQMCLQFCVDVQIPEELQGSNGEAVYISTDFGFQVERYKEICQGAIKHFGTFDFPNKEVKEKCLNRLTLENLLNGVKVLKIHELGKLYEILHFMKTYFETNENVKLVVIDSFSLPMNLYIQDSGRRTKIIAFFVSSLLGLAVKYKFAVVLTNQFMTIVSGQSASCVRPALGQSYAHRIHRRVILRDNIAYLTKSVSEPQTFTTFKVTTDGLR